MMREKTNKNLSSGENKNEFRLKSPASDSLLFLC